MLERKVIPHSTLKEWGPRFPILCAGLFSIYLLNVNTYYGIAGIVICVAAGIVVERLQSRMMCPDCKVPTSRYKKSKEPGAPIEFYCAKCKVIWDTGRRNSRGANRENHWE